MKTIRLLYPDYLSGGLDTYYFGAELLSHIVPANENQPLLRVELGPPDGSGGGRMTFERLSRVLGMITEESNVVGFTIAEYLPFDEHKLHDMLAGLRIFTE